MMHIFRGFSRGALVLASACCISLFLSTALIGVCLADNYNVTYQYDASGRLKGVAYSSDISIQYSYDAAGNMVIKNVLLLSECSECTASPVVLKNVTFESGRQCACSDGTSITIGAGVTIESGANIVFRAPIIKVTSGFEAKEGALVKMQQE